MTPMVVTPAYQGPLELLLELAERRKLNFNLVSISLITTDYAQAIKERPLKAQELGEFIHLGSRLAYIKSLWALPSEPAAARDELASLSGELEAYRRFKAAASHLARQTGAPSFTRARPERHDLPVAAPANVTAEALARALAVALARHQPATVAAPRAPRLSQAAALSNLTTRLAGGGFDFDEVVAGAASRTDVVVYFSALLELLRQGAVTVRQTARFGRITVGPAGA